MLFVDPENAYNRVPRELIYYSLRRKVVPEAYINIIRDMYAGCKTSVMTSAGKTNEIEIEVGLHLGSAISPHQGSAISPLVRDHCRCENRRDWGKNALGNADRGRPGGVRSW